MSPVPATDATLDGLLDRAVRTYPDRIAVADERARLSYRELDELSSRIAGRLSAEGVRAGDRVLLVLDNRIEYIALEQALMRSGVVRVGLNTRLHAAEACAIAEDARPALAFVEARWLDRSQASGLPDFGCPVVVVGDDRGTGVLESFVDGPVDPFEPPHSGDDLAWLLYTSGTTGTPKGVMHSHSSILAAVRLLREVLPPLSENDVALHTAPLSHMSGAVALTTMGAGGTNAVRARFDPRTVVDDVREHSVSVLPLVPTQLVMLTTFLGGDTAGVVDLASIRTVPYAGSAIAPDRLDAATGCFGPVLTQLYGSSECVMPVTALRPHDHTSRTNRLGLPRSASAGQVTSETEIAVLDEHGRAVPPGCPGELVVRTPAATTGYWRNQTATAELIDRDGWFHSGDVGIIDENGYLFIVDRKKDMIVSGGFNVYPREVENALSEMPGVSEVVVVSEPSDDWGEGVVAVIVPEAGYELSLDAVQSWCRERIAAYKIPRRLEIVTGFPRSGAGKVLKRVISEAFWADRPRRVGS